jgi:predicted SAM-dependent methyltransferase
VKNKEDTVVVPEHQQLNMGCGFKRLLDYWNVDVWDKCNPDQVIDHEELPWPFEDNFFKKIHADSILEHLGQTPQKFLQIIKEMYRVSAPDCVWNIIVPHHRCDNFFNDFTHVRIITEHTFRLFDQVVNNASRIKKLSDSLHGIQNDIDLEVLEVNYELTSLFKDLLNEGMLGSKQLNIDLNTKSNVCESVVMTIKVHKPGRVKW